MSRRRKALGGIFSKNCEAAVKDRAVLMFRDVCFTYFEHSRGSGSERD